MNRRRKRIETVLRVRRIQETQAAGEFTKASLAARQAEVSLSTSMVRYNSNRTLDLRADTVDAVLRDRETRVFQAKAIQLARQQVRDTIDAMEEHRDDLRIRTQAVKAMERLDERLRDEEEEDRLDQEQREADDRSRPQIDRAAELFP